MTGSQERSGPSAVGGAAEAPRVGGPWLDAPETQAVMAALSGGGHRALAVGGCVRDALLGVPVADVDLATDAPPERVSALAEAAGMKAVPTGIEHGTVTVVAGGVPHEVTTFRRDLETDGRHAVVAFTDQVAEDAARRDFTMNALYAEADGRLVDPLGGLPDLRARRLRFVGDPGGRIREDHLRILRFFRFHAWYGDPATGLDAEGLLACEKLAERVERLSGERVGAEMKRLLAAPDPGPSLLAMDNAAVLGRVAPGADPEVIGPLVAAEAGRPPAWERRLLAMGGGDVATRWRLSRAEGKRLSVRREALVAGTPALEVAYRCGAEAGLDVTLIRRSRGMSSDFDGCSLAEKMVRRTLRLGNVPQGTDLEAVLENDLDRYLRQAAAVRFPLCAADLMPMLSGPALGAALREAEAAWIASGFALDRDELRRQALGG